MEFRFDSTRQEEQSAAGCFCMVKTDLIEWEKIENFSADYS